ncbi:MAG TPA: Rieske (2Fe-2S) protein [Cellvibrionaceae bacterium]|nr:Rieske (2Fe-2S) protein [Cellvibrionaceae bacterium]HMW73095.1 Rieske (2Fe-2S) protein [Cellvibrionaceae bacterium]HNG58599.1 Rieske (2Fe-2S) protein [Cellvibrionaceae bacterium]
MANEHWVCRADDIACGTAKGFCIAEERFFILNQGGEFRAYRNRCPHLNIPLEWQEDSFLCKDTDLVRCATHGALFLPENGLCVSGPCAGQSLEPLTIALRRDGIYWLQAKPTTES